MQIRELFVSSFRSLISNKRRSILTMIGIIIGIASVITILSLGDGARLAMLKNLEASSNGQQSTEINFVSTNFDDQNIAGFSQQDLNQIRENKNIAKVSIQSDEHGILSVDGLINGKKINNLALLTNTAINSHLIAGKGISTNDLLVSNPVALVNKTIAKKGYKTVQNALNSSIEISGVSYTIVGVIDDTAGNSYGQYGIVIPKKIFEMNNDSIVANTVKLHFTVGTNAVKETQKIANQLNKKGSHHNDGTYEFFDMQSLLKGIGTVIQGITYFIVAVAGISLFIAGIGVMNMMYISVSERTQEIGIRMAVGASQRQILWQFLIEAMMLTLIGGMIGYLSGVGIAMLVSIFLPFKASVSISTFLLAFGTSTIVGLIFGILPAKTASNKNLIDILR
ncbi:MAG: ABC transporter permease [Lactobacillaceae bacterium]|jgi:putative ABC transport system permease protein|nr:ABC transporter permease [Lactobacillaceae bacterium]